MRKNLSDLNVLFTKAYAEKAPLYFEEVAVFLELKKDSDRNRLEQERITQSWIKKSIQNASASFMGRDAF